MIDAFAVSVDLFIAVLCFFSLLGLYISYLEAENAEGHLRDDIHSLLANLKSSLENRLYLNIHITEGIKALVAMNPDLTQEDFARAMKINFEGDHDLRNIGLAPNKEIRKIERGSHDHVPIIAITAGVTKDELDKCFSAGMDDFISKPITYKKIISLLIRYNN